MPLNKQTVDIAFAQGLDTKTDPKRVSIGKFLSLENSIFDIGGLLQKRNGFGLLSALPDSSYQYLTTLNGNLTAIGNNLSAYSLGSNKWINTGALNPTDISVSPLVRSGTNQTQSDSSVSPNDLVCTVYVDNNGSSSVPKYIITDYNTGQEIAPATVIAGTGGAVIDSPRVFLLGNYFIIMFGALISGVNHLQYIAVNYNSLTANTAANLTSLYTPAATLPFDAVVANGNLYIAWNGNDGGGAIRLQVLSRSLALLSSSVIGPSTGGTSAAYLSMAVDSTGSIPNIWVNYYTSGGGGYAFAVDTNLNTVLAATATIASGSPDTVNLACIASGGVLTYFYEIAATYAYDATIPTDYIKSNTLTSGGTSGTAAVLVRSVGLASKAFVIAGVPYFLSVYASAFQPSYFLINGLTGGVVAKLAYSNGAATLTPGSGYLPTGLPNVNVHSDGVTVDISYRFADLIASVNKAQGVANAAGIYSQTGVNLGTIEFSSQNIFTTELGSNLNICGGLTRSYDGAVPVEQNFNLWPDYVEATPSSTGGGVSAQQYFYQAIYQWTDSQGNIFRSAPSVPTSVNLANATETTTFKGTFSTSSKVVTITDGLVGNLIVGQTVADTTTSGNISSGTVIASIDIAANTITLNNFPAGNSASSPGDVLTAILTPFTFTASFDSGSNYIFSSSSVAASLLVGQLITDATTSANLQANTYVTSIDSSGKIIGISLPTTAAASSDTISTSSTLSVTVNIPTLRLTYKTANPASIILYRWSTAQQDYFQCTSISSPLLNNPAVDYVTFTDTQADANILGNSLIYTTGGVVEDIGPPASTVMTIFDDRLWLVDAEDRNLLWFSKQVIEGTPVELSDLLTLYIAPTIGAEGSTGPITALSTMDDKLVIFKQNAIYYINGTGPDNTASNSSYSQPTFITATVGCVDQNSIVFTPNGLMFQSNKGIWLLGRDLSTSYIGAPVQKFNSSAVVSSLSIPDTNQIRFTLNTGQTMVSLVRS